MDIVIYMRRRSNTLICKICHIEGFRFEHQLNQHFAQCYAKQLDIRRRRLQRQQQQTKRYNTQQQTKRYNTQQQTKRYNTQQPKRYNTQQPKRYNTQQLIRTRSISQQEQLRQKNIQRQYSEQKRMQLLKRKQFQKYYNQKPRTISF